MHHQKLMKIGTKIQPFPDQISYSGADAGGVHNSWQAGSDKKQQYNRGHLERLGNSGTGSQHGLAEVDCVLDQDAISGITAPSSRFTKSTCSSIASMPIPNSSCMPRTGSMPTTGTLCETKSSTNDNEKAYRQGWEQVLSRPHQIL